MDLETENRIAALLMKEAAELRRQSEKEGALAYLRKPNVRGRPNSRFLTATVLGVQQANRAVEVNEMWKVRQKEIDLSGRLKGRSTEENKSGNGRIYGDNGNSLGRTRKRNAFVDKESSASCSSRKRSLDNSHSEDEEGLRDEELEEFLHSRAKRGRGAVGPRMDEAGPYLPPSPGSTGKLLTSADLLESHVAVRIYGPEKPSFLKSGETSEEELEGYREKRKKDRCRSSKKHHSSKHDSKEKSRDKKSKRNEEKRWKNHK